MTEYDHHEDVSFKVVDAYVEPEQEGEDGPVLADRIVLETDDFKGSQITIRPKYSTTKQTMQDGMKVKETVKERYPIPQLPEKLKKIIKEAQDAEITLKADVGEVIPEDGGERSYFIRWDMTDTIEKVETTILDGDEGEQ